MAGWGGFCINKQKTVEMMEKGGGTGRQTINRGDVCEAATNTGQIYTTLLR